MALKSFYSISEVQKLLDIPKNRISHIIRNGLTLSKFKGQGVRILLRPQDIALVLLSSALLDMGLSVQQIPQFIRYWSHIPFYKWTDALAIVDGNRELRPVYYYNKDKNSMLLLYGIKMNLRGLAQLLLEKLNPQKGKGNIGRAKIQRQQFKPKPKSYAEVLTSNA